MDRGLKEHIFNKPIYYTLASTYLHIRKLWFGMYFAAVKVNRGLALDQVFWQFAMFVKDSLYIEQDGKHLLSIEFLPRA